MSNSDPFSSPLSSLPASPASLYVDITDLCGTMYWPPQNAGQTHASITPDLAAEDNDTRRQSVSISTGNVTPEVHPIALRERSRRGISPNHQYWLETRSGLTAAWVNDRPVFEAMHPSDRPLDVLWSPNMPPREFLRPPSLGRDPGVSNTTGVHRALARDGEREAAAVSNSAGNLRDMPRESLEIGEQEPAAILPAAENLRDILQEPFEIGEEPAVALFPAGDLRDMQEPLNLGGQEDAGVSNAGVPSRDISVGLAAISISPAVSSQADISWTPSPIGRSSTEASQDLSASPRFAGDPGRTPRALAERRALNLRSYPGRDQSTTPTGESTRGTPRFRVLDSRAQTSETELSALSVTLGNFSLETTEYIPPPRFYDSAPPVEDDADESSNRSTSVGSPHGTSASSLSGRSVASPPSARDNRPQQTPAESPVLPTRLYSLLVDLGGLMFINAETKWDYLSGAIKEEESEVSLEQTEGSGMNSPIHGYTCRDDFNMGSDSDSLNVFAFQIEESHGSDGRASTPPLINSLKDDLFDIESDGRASALLDSLDDGLFDLRSDGRASAPPLVDSLDDDLFDLRSDGRASAPPLVDSLDDDLFDLRSDSRASSPLINTLDDDLFDVQSDETAASPLIDSSLDDRMFDVRSDGRASAPPTFDEALDDDVFDVRSDRRTSSPPIFDETVDDDAFDVRSDGQASPSPLIDSALDDDVFDVNSDRSPIIDEALDDTMFDVMSGGRASATPIDDEYDGRLLNFATTIGTQDQNPEHAGYAIYAARDTMLQLQAMVEGFIALELGLVDHLLESQCD